MESHAVQRRVDEAFLATPRAGFLTAATRASAAEDRPLPIGHGQTNSQPTTVRNMLALLDVRQGQHVLDIGAGSGWTTTLLAWLTGPEGIVLGLELEPDLAARGAANLAATDRPWARIEPAVPGVLGRPDGAPYDRILVSAAARRLPEDLVAQLRDDPADPGVMVAPVAGVMLRVRRAGGRPEITEHGYYRFVPLR